MQLGLIGLGRMGSGMTLRLLQGGHQVMVYDRVPEAGAALAGKGATVTGSLEDLGQKLKSPRVLWLMIPAGPPVDDAIQHLSGTLSPGDIIIDGGNSNYKDSIRRAEALRSQQVEFLDVGVSGGIWGLTVGFNLMIGGNQAVFKQAEPIFKTLAPPDGYAYVGPSGAGHYSKMVHNGIEYSMLQSYAEGFEILKAAPFGFDLQQLAKLWNHGSVIRSWLLELAQAAFERDPQLSRIRGYVDDSGEGRWTLQEAIDRAVPAPALAMSLFMRFRSRQDDSFSDKVVAALRNEFGGHPVKAE
ncbi:MAG TPA: decarboxylating 6-phosphogluconate dehydrogenase [Candidatus Dormibacteraeota bacterium]|nr:decarboxylating 6-phosphogluconate dehydrogenase [Candidatus Dormibacteraeota bacterium]